MNSPYFRLLEGSRSKGVVGTMKLKWIFLFFGFVVNLATAGIDDYYELENVPLPEALSMASKNGTQVDGLDFFPDGRLAVCFVDGQVYTLEAGYWRVDFVCGGLTHSSRHFRC